MKVQKIIGNLFLTTCILYIGWLGYCEFLKRQFPTNLTNAISAYTHEKDIVLKDLTPFEWDEFYWGYSDSYGFAGASIGNVWKFYQGDYLIAEINIGSKSPQVLLNEKCLCPTTAEYLEPCFTPSTAIFKIVGDKKNEIVHLKSTICGN